MGFFYRISELVLPTLIQRYDKKTISFLIQFKKRDKLKFYRMSDATFYGRINTIYQSIKPFLGKKCLFLRNMEPMFLFSSHEVLPGSVVFHSLMSLSSDFRFSSFGDFARIGCVLQLNAFIVRCSPQ